MAVRRICGEAMKSSPMPADAIMSVLKANPAVFTYGRDGTVSLVVR